MKVGTRGQSIGVNHGLKTIVSLVDRRVPIPLASLRRGTRDRTPVPPFLTLPLHTIPKSVNTIHD